MKEGGYRFESQFGGGLSVWSLHVVPVSTGVFSGFLPDWGQVHWRL